MLGSAHHDVSGEETDLCSTLEHCAVGQCHAHPEVGVVEQRVQGQDLPVGRYRGDGPHLVLSLTVPEKRENGKKKIISKK